MACHEPVNANTVVFLLAKMKALGELYTTVTNKYELPLNAGSALALSEEEMSSGQCVQCHTGAGGYVLVGFGLLVVAATFLARGRLELRVAHAGEHERVAEAAADRVARLEVERVVKLALENLTGVRTVLDIGTGSGLFAEAFASRGLQVFGVDANPEMLPEAQKFVPAGTFREAAAEKLPCWTTSTTACS